MRAIILAAGRGTRLLPHTKDIPKCLVELAGAPLLVHQLQTLKAAGIDDIHIATGHHAEQLVPFGCPTRHNPRYAQTNMVETLMCASDLLDGGDDVIIAYSDIVYEPRLIEAVSACEDPFATIIDRQWRRLWEIRFEDPLSDAETLRIDDAGCICDIGRRPESFEEVQGQYIGITKVSASMTTALVEFHKHLGDTGEDLDHLDMTSFLRRLIAHRWPLYAIPVDGGWLEVDGTRDLELYRGLYARGQLDALWRAPDMAGAGTT